MKSKFHICCIFLLSSICLQAQKIKEIWYDKTPVSGDIRVGIVNEIDENYISPNSEKYYAYIPNKPIKGDSLCTVISSRDGRYKGEISTALKDEMRGKIQEFAWKTQYENNLTAMKKSEITMLSMVAKTCDSDPEYYTLSQWSPKKTEMIYVALNSEKKPYIKIKNKGKQPFKCKCEKLKGEINVNYNYICKIPLEKLNKKSKIDVVQRVVRLSTVTSLTYPIKLKVPLHE